jgi:Major capsid protein Gp23
MSDIKSLLTNNQNPQARLMEETRQLRGKWEKTGLLEGLKGIEQANMSILLENQAQQLLSESTATGTSANSEQWAGVALPLVRRVFAEIAAKEFVSVQPMNLPSGLIFYLDFKYGTSGKTKTTGSSLFGGNGIKLGSTDAAVNGLYGAGSGYYTTNQVQATVGNITGSATGTSNDVVTSSVASDLQYDSNYVSGSTVGTGVTFPGNYFTITLNLDDNTAAASGSNGIYNADLNSVRGWNISGSGIYSTLNQFSEVYNTGSISNPYYQAQFVVSGSSTLATGARTAITVTYTQQPTDSSRGDFEDKNPFGSVAGNSGTDIGIPEVNLELKSEPIVAKTRKLKAVWTPELAQDLNAYHSIDAEAELTALLSEYVSMEIDLEILDMLITAAPAATTEAWSAFIGAEFTKTLTGANQNVASFTRTQDNTYKTAYVKQTWFQTLGNKIQKVSNKIHQLTLRGGANFLVCSPDVATILESIPGFVVNTDGDSAKFAMGVSRVGSFASRFQVYKNPYMTENVILVGFRGNNFLETGAVYAPYIPLVQTPLVYDPINFTPRRGVLTRYAKKVVRPEFYGKIYIADVDKV